MPRDDTEAREDHVAPPADEGPSTAYPEARAVQTAAGERGMRRRLSTPRTVLACACIAVIAWSAWSLASYAGGRDLPSYVEDQDNESPVPRTTAEAVDDEQADGRQHPEAGSERAAEESTSGAPDTFSDSREADAEGAAAEGAEGVVTEPAAPSASAPEPDRSPTAPTDGASNSEASAPAPEEILVTVVVNGSVGGAGSDSAQVVLPAGSTALDALRATGVDVQTRPYGGGSWVSAIAGLAEGGGRGWTYRVDGALPGVMSDRYALADGATVTWTYV